MRRTLPSHDQSAVIVHPGKSSLEFPAGLVHRSCLDWTTTLRFLPLLPLKSRDGRLDTSLAQFSSKSTAVIGFISRQRSRSSARAASGLWHSDGLQRLIGQRNFMRLSAIQMQTNRQAIVIYDQHYLATFADFRLAYSGAPLFAGTKLPSRKACAHSSFPWASSLLNRARQIISQVPSPDHWLNRRQQVVEDPYSAGISCHAQPVLRM